MKKLIYKDNKRWYIYQGKNQQGYDCYVSMSLDSFLDDINDLICPLWTLVILLTIKVNIS
jgi:hypothetical protein